MCQTLTRSRDFLHCITITMIQVAALALEAEVLDYTLDSDLRPSLFYCNRETATVKKSCQGPAPVTIQ